MSMFFRPFERNNSFAKKSLVSMLAKHTQAKLRGFVKLHIFFALPRIDQCEEPQSPGLSFHKEVQEIQDKSKAQKTENSKHKTTMIVAITALIISLVSLLMQIIRG
jgi:hypothetical protein